jgi:tetratricopeptide (TPR) repeat protein
MFAFRDEIRFSRLFTCLQARPMVLVSESVSRTLLDSKAVGTTPQRLASFVDGIVSDAHQTRICPTTSCPDPNTRDAKVLLVIGGSSNSNRVALDVSVPRPHEKHGSPPAPSRLEDVLAEIDSSHSLLANAYDEGSVIIRIDAPPDGLGEVVKTAVHLASAIRRVRDGQAADAERDVKAFLAQLRMLTTEQTSRDWVLDGVLFVASYYDHAKDWDHALYAVDEGLRFFPSEPRLKVAKAYIKLEGGGTPDAGAFVPFPSDADPPIVSVLRTVMKIRDGEFLQAGLLLEKAAAAAEESATPERRFWLHAAVAYLLGLTTGDPVVRGRRIVDHADRALRIFPDVRLMRLLNGFGYVISENAALATTVFDALRHAARATDQCVECDYWQARGAVETHHLDEARRILRPIAAGASPSAPILGLLAELTWQEARTKEDVDHAEKLAKEALALNPDEAKGNRVLGFVKADQATRLSRQEREHLEQEALQNLQKAVRGQGSDADILAQMSYIYRDLARAIEAGKAGRESLEASCSMANDRLACNVVEVRRRLDKPDPDGAKDATNAMLTWMTNHPVGDRDQIHRVEMATQLAIAWYEREDANRAEQIYGITMNAIKMAGDFPRKRQALAQVECNLGFVYIDQRLSPKAIQEFKKSLATDPGQPDCEAGLAVALEEDRQPQAALAEYRLAVSHDDTYGPDRIEVLRNSNFWSSTACGILNELAKRAADTRKGL